ncbi:MAG TPA: MBL fold metallo-hydrolase [Bacteroidales bacterium]|nr:MBL fold metallo-hydrolase [Bacteroidales bacterium]
MTLIQVVSSASFSHVNLKAQTDIQWFSLKEVSEKVWQINSFGNNKYLIEGRDSSLLIDNGLGVADLTSLVKKLTSKPLIVVNTHSHPDHAGANYQFEKVYLHAADTSIARQYNLPERRAEMSEGLLRRNRISKSDLFKGKPLNTKLLSVTEGHIFNLGDRRIQVMETPGHTLGSICLLDIENRLLFSGDNNDIMVSLFLQDCTPLHIYLETLEKQRAMISEFYILLPGHGEPIPSDIINDQIKCVKGILDGTCQSKEFKTFVGNSMICTFGRVSVVYNPENL